MAAANSFFLESLLLALLGGLLGCLLALPMNGFQTGIGNWEYTEITQGLEAGARVVVSIDREGLADGVPAVAR